MKSFCLLSTFILLYFFAFPQGKEAKVPLLSNPKLRGLTVDTKSEIKPPIFSKASTTSGIYPFIDWFNHPGQQLSDSLWTKSHARIQNSRVVFNALDSNGVVHGGAGNNGDILHSQTFSYYPQNQEAYVLFNYSTGSTWLPTDSLVLRFKTSGGNYVSIWTSDANPAEAMDILINIAELYNYSSVNFDFEFVCYTNLSNTNTQTFLLHHFTLSDKWSLPVYENFYLFDSVRKLPSPAYWMKRQTNTNTNLETGFGNSNTVVFDSYDEFGNVYHNANGLTGNTDTLISHLINLKKFDVADSVYLRFYVKALDNATLNDSLFLEFRNNAGAGLWTRIWNVNGSVKNKFIPVYQLINYGKFRGENFQFRLISKGKYSASDSLKFMVAGVNAGRRRALPFIDDFSGSVLYPDQRNWSTKHTYINNHFPVRPPSVNVATFDALDKNGNAYITGTRYSDTLTSVSINLSSLSASDTGVYLSFWVEPKGLGDSPNQSDSLILEFRNSATNNTAYRNVWKGARSAYPTDTFTLVTIHLDTNWFHDDFQFRFKNVSTKYGNLNHWHLDYVRLDKSGLAAMSYYNDVALSETPGTMITPYTSMPYTHFAVNPAGFLKSSQTIKAFNNAATAKPISWSREIFNPSGARIDTFGSGQGNVIREITAILPGISNLNTAPNSDSTVFSARYTSTTFGSGDNNILSNDTASVVTVFSNYYAYDDGSAENGYAIQNTTGKVALEYNLTKSDTLFGVTMFFNQSVSDVSTRNFDLLVWRNINTNGNGTGEDELGRYSLLSPVYTNSINGFYFYKFVNPIILPAGKFYIGWSQSQIFSLNIGLDENYFAGNSAVNPNMYYFLDDIGVWQQTTLTGALMLRPVIGKWLDPPVSVGTVYAKEEPSLSVYPNPAQDYIYIKGWSDKPYTICLLDISGRTVVQPMLVKDKLDLPELPAGMYFVHVIDDKGINRVKKILIQR